MAVSQLIRGAILVALAATGVYIASSPGAAVSSDQVVDQEGRGQGYGARAEVERGLARRYPKHSFAEVVHKYFARWDRNHDGKVTAKDILYQVMNPSVTGEEAAAVAAIHQVQRFTGKPLPPMTAEQIIHFHKTPKLPLAREYVINWRLIRAARRVVFAADAPSLRDFHQGHEGDCYFLAVLGAAVARDPAAVRSMLRPVGDGACELHFPGGGRVRVPRVTDAEIALGSHDLSQGLWGTYFEKGYGLLEERVKRPPPANDPIDAIGHEGWMGPVIHLFTGHRVGSIDIARERHKPDLERRLAHVLKAAHQQRRLACCSTPNRKDVPPGVYYNHVYAVLGYRPEERLVELWNPYGNSFSPRGRRGLAHGYPTHGGKFVVPLHQLVDFIDHLGWEEEAPQTASGTSTASAAAGISWIVPRGEDLCYGSLAADVPTAGGPCWQSARWVFPGSTLVNNPRNDSPKCLEPAVTKFAELFSPTEK